MIRKLSKLLRNESGITALETAIILIAFVVVASVFAFTILSAGTFSTERGKEAIYSGLEEVSSSMEVKGSIYAASADKLTVDVITFTLGLVSGGDPVLITSTNKVVVMSYREPDTFVDNIAWTPRFITHQSGDTDWLLEGDELVEIAIDVSGYDLDPNEDFALEVKPPAGAVVSIQRTVPAGLDTVMDLH